MEDNELLEVFVASILVKQGMESTPHSIVRHARQCLNELRKAQFNLDGEKFVVPANSMAVYDN